MSENRGHEGNEEDQEKPRPRVVDKRGSARGAGAAAETAHTEPAPAEAPSAEPRAEEPPPQQVWTPEQEAEAKRVADEIVKTPGPDWIINVAVTLANVAGVKLDAGELSDAGLVIDALAGVINSTGPRLGDAEAPLRRTLAQLQLGFAERSGGAPSA
ncbi:MAG: hypothetical protein ACRDKB_03375 [Actinomycetota bacterium]